MPNTYNPSGTSITDYSSIKFIPGDIINGSYSGAVNPVKLPAGNYQLECWGGYGGIGYSGSLTSSTTTSWIYIGSGNATGYFNVNNDSNYYFRQDGNDWIATNGGINSSTATTTLTCTSGGTYKFSYYYKTEASYDKVTLMVGGTTVLNAVSGSSSLTTTGTYSLSSGSTIVMTYSKDDSNSVDNEEVYFQIQKQESNTTYTPASSKNSYWGGTGGYSTGILSLSTPTSIYLYTGGHGNYLSDSEKGKIVNGGFNGGGSSKIRWYTSAYSSGGGGGGASDIRIGQDSLYARVIVAGGGGGGAGESNSSVKQGGGLTGNSAVEEYKATQTKAGTNGSFGQGANSTGSGNYNYGPGGGGGGWYGGGASTNVSDGSADYRTYNGGGSGYVYTSSTASNYPSGCLLNSNYYLTNASTAIGYSKTNPGGTHGYIRITVLSPLNVKINSNTYAPIKAIYTKIDNTTWKGGVTTWQPMT